MGREYANAKHRNLFFNQGGKGAELRCFSYAGNRSKEDRRLFFLFRIFVGLIDRRDGPGGVLVASSSSSSSRRIESSQFTSRFPLICSRYAVMDAQIIISFTKL